MVIAPLDANTLAKIATGLCDNLLVNIFTLILNKVNTFQTCILRAWDLKKRVFVCPAMNTMMWEHPFTANHLNILAETLGFKIIQPINKTLICGETGK